MSYHFQCRIYYEDTDAGGVVYHASYLRFLERARTEMLREKMFEQHKLSENKILFAVQGLEIKYIKPAYLDDLLNITTSIEQQQPTRLYFKQTIHRSSDQTLITVATVTVVCVSPPPFRVQKIPPFIKNLVEEN